MLTLFGVEMFRRWCLRKQILDVPNERSSHHLPTPRGGGLIIVAVCLAGFSFIAWKFNLQNSFYYFIGAIIVAAVSWLDDLFTLSVVWRFFAHALAAAIVLFGAGYPQQIYFPFLGTIDFGAWSFIFWFLWIVWLINAYNFMDGIDGIAGTQALTAAVGWFILMKLFGANELSVYAGVIAASSLGFLIHNWHPAKIFMGDVGSAFYGYTFAAIPLLIPPGNVAFGKNLFLISIILVYFFVFDSVLTLTRRLLRGEKVWKAHREHLYQRLTAVRYSHSQITGLYGFLSALVILTLYISVIYTDTYILTTLIFSFLISIFLFIFVTLEGNNLKLFQKQHNYKSEK